MSTLATQAATALIIGLGAIAVLVAIDLAAAMIGEAPGATPPASLPCDYCAGDGVVHYPRDAPPEALRQFPHLFPEGEEPCPICRGAGTLVAPASATTTRPSGPTSKPCG